MSIAEYFENLEKEVQACYSIANEARKKGIDPINEVEVPLAHSLSERVVGLVSILYPQIIDDKIVKRILELEQQHGSLDPAVALIIAEEIAKEKYCKFSSHIEALEAGIRIALGYLTLGYVSSPIEGFTQLKVKKTRGGNDFIASYYSGPIRSAGGSEAAFSLVVVDYLREIFGYALYDPTDEEVKRGIQECYEYHERVTNLQYLPSEKELDFLMRNLSIQLTGDPSEDKEVYNYKDLPRIETNFIRSGFALVMGEGLAQKAPKILGRIVKLRKKGFALPAWNWLEDFVKLQKRIKEDSSSNTMRTGATYIQDLVAGRPVFSHPSRSGAFRLRYGRARNTGYSTLAVHPATMAITESFIAIGTQLKIEKPTKGCTVASCDSISGPIIRLKDGSVKIINDFAEAKAIYQNIDEIIYLGDLLVPYGDFLNRNHLLEKAGYVEQYWLEELIAAGGAREIFPSFSEAIFLSEKYKIPLHPDFIYYWSQIDYKDFLSLLDWIAHGHIHENILVLPYTHIEKERFKKGKRSLELIGCPHSIATDSAVLKEKDTKTLLFNLGILDLTNLEKSIDLTISKVKEQDVLSLVNLLCPARIKDKAGTFIGARMGRPEKAKLRKLEGSPHVLFPVGEEGGRMRSFQEAIERGGVSSEFPVYFCRECKNNSPYGLCEQCGRTCLSLLYCPVCDKTDFSFCQEHNRGVPYQNRRLDIKHYFSMARKKSGLNNGLGDLIVKGVRGTSNKDHQCEYLGKGILRAKHNLHVNKDGTIRYDMTEMPITHFKPKEIGTSVQRLRSLGYDKDIFRKELINDEQLLEIFPHDLILPACPITPDEKADDIFLDISKFVDDELQNLYQLKPFYKAKKYEDIIGSLAGCIAPHTASAVVGRIIGFSKIQALLASPYIHAAMRRDCVFPSTKLFFYDNKNKDIFYTNIGEYVEKLIREGALTKKIDSFGTLSVENIKDLYALGIDPMSHELKKKKIKYFIKGPENKKWIKVTTATNREYIMTETHDFMYMQDGKFMFKKARYAKVNDALPVLETFRFDNEKRDINLIELFKEKLSEKELNNILVNNLGKEVKLLQFLGEINDGTTLRHTFSHHFFSAKLRINTELMRILGYYAAEGYSRQNKSVSQVSFRICDVDTQKHLIYLIKKCFGMEASLGEDNSKITICSKLIYFLFKCIESGKGAYEKRVPTFVFGLSKELVKSYISAYFEGDGSIIRDKRVISFYSVSRDLLDDIALLLCKFSIFGRYFKTELRYPGKKVLEKYKILGKKPKQHSLNHLVLGVRDSYQLGQLLYIASKEKEKGLAFLRNTEKRFLQYNGKQVELEAQSDYVIDYVKKVEIVEDIRHSYCVEVEWNEKEDRNVLWGEQIINTRCDGDEAAVFLLMDLLLNFSRRYLPSHRGGTQDAPLVLNVRIKANEVDDMIFDFDVGEKIPLKLYESAEKHLSPAEVQMEQIRNRLGTGKEFEGINYSYETSDINLGPLCSSYKTLPSMQDKVEKMMELCMKIRAVDADDVARLIIERHFIRDTKGNLRKFSQQGFRCVACNSKYRRPPLSGKCLNCGGRLIFTVAEGSILKYLQPALDLARTYKVSPYLLESLELTEMYIQSIFGKEKEKQEALERWF